MYEARKKTVLSVVAVILAGVLIFSGCKKKASDEITFGSMNGSVYSNEYFGLTIEFPEDWAVAEKETLKQVTDMGTDFLAGDDKNLKAIVKASELQTVNLFMVSQHPLGSPVPFNPNVTAVAERIRHMPGIKSGKDYLYHARKLMESSALDASFTEEVRNEQIGGYSFDIMTAEMNMSGASIKQQYYATVLKGYVLGVIISYSNDQDQAALKEILATIKKSD